MLFLGYFYVLFAIIVSYIYLYIYLYNCVYMLIHILSTFLSTLSTTIIVYNCVCDFQKICLMILPHCIYNLLKKIFHIFLPIYIYIFSYIMFLPIYI